MTPDHPPAWRESLALQAQIKATRAAIGEEYNRHRRVLTGLYGRIARAEVALASLQGEASHADAAPAGADPGTQAGRGAT